MGVTPHDLYIDKRTHDSATDECGSLEVIHTASVRGFCPRFPPHGGEAITPLTQRESEFHEGLVA